jgi:hypothetical protein
MCACVFLVTALAARFKELAKSSRRQVFRFAEAVRDSNLFQRLFQPRRCLGQSIMVPAVDGIEAQIGCIE